MSLIPVEELINSRAAFSDTVITSAKRTAKPSKTIEDDEVLEDLEEAPKKVEKQKANPQKMTKTM